MNIAKMAYGSAQNSPQTLSDWKLVAKGFAFGAIVVVAIYIGIHLLVANSEEQGKVPGLQNTICMLIYGFGYVFGMGYMTFLCSKLARLTRDSENPAHQ